MCRRAVLVVSDLNVTFLENTQTGLNKYYAMDVQMKIVKPSMNFDKPPETEIVVQQVFIQAFLCPTNPEIYVNVNAEPFTTKTLWINMKKNGRDPDYELMGYQLRLLTSITEGIVAR